MDISKLFGGNRNANHPISSNHHKKIRYIHQDLELRLGKDKADQILNDSDVKYLDLQKQHIDLPPAVKQHTDLIFMNAAMYLCICDHLPKEAAYQIMEDATVKYAKPIGHLLDNVTRLPGMPRLFMKVFRKMLKTSFNDDAGFVSRYYETTDKAISVDIMACPYHKYFTEAGCPELCKVSCESDDVCYGNMKHVEFQRSQTIGRGGECCDFRLRVK
ncbi:MAG: L-2-amino-thiazoline-4-carboxylic acid hydrolase [Solobacterium sp.]|nr:L-2-amino-thiazoline-4-carboxylic acid hydrolase [Solobacterium sp.]